jgi:hypothetical protein
VNDERQHPSQPDPDREPRAKGLAKLKEKAKAETPQEPEA